MKAYTKVKRTCIHHRLTILMLLGILFGAMAGSIAGAYRRFSQREIMYFGFLGDIFLRVLGMIALPLLVSCLVSALASLQEGLPLNMILNYLAITAALNLEGAFLTIGFALAIRPGSSGTQADNATTHVVKFMTLQDMFLDLGRNFVPPNPIGMFAQTYETVLRRDDEGEHMFIYGGHMVSSVNMVGVVVAAIVFGLVLKKLGEEGQYLRDVIDGFTAITFLWMKWIMFASPLLLASLVGAQIMKVGLAHLIARTGKYMATFLSYHLMQLLVMYPLAFFVLTRKNPFPYYSGKVLLTAFGTSSTLATLPIALDFLEHKCGFEPRFVRVFLSIGVNISKVGNIMTLCGMCIFVAQSDHMDVNITLLLKILLLSAPISIAIPGVPYSMIAGLVSVLTGCGISTDDIGLVISVEWLNDRFVTSINVVGNLLTVAIMAHFYEELFFPENEKESLDSVIEE